MDYSFFFWFIKDKLKVSRAPVFLMTHLISDADVYVVVRYTMLYKNLKNRNDKDFKKNLVFGIRRIVMQNHSYKCLRLHFFKF